MANSEHLQEQAKNEKILVVDDNENILGLLKDILKAKGYQVVTAEDGAEALRLAREDEPHLVLLDSSLPKIDGFTVCKMLRESENTRYIPIIIVTCESSIQEKIMGLESGADDYIVKPFCLEEVLARVKSLLRLRNLYNKGSIVRCIEFPPEYHQAGISILNYFLARQSGGIN